MCCVFEDEYDRAQPKKPVERVVYKETFVATRRDLSADAITRNRYFGVGRNALFGGATGHRSN